nr:phosphate acyltransferase [Caldithrix abyssi]
MARKKITDWDAYRDSLESRLGRTHEVSRILINKAKDIKKRIVLPEGEEIKVLRAAQILIDEEIVSPILLGNKEQILKMAKEHDLDISRAEIVEYASCQKIDAYVDELYRLRQRKGLTRNACRRLLTTDPNYFGVMMVRMGDADGMVSGVNHYYPEVIRPALQILEVQKDKKFIAGLYAMVLKKETIFFADTTVNIESTAEILANTAIMVADKVKKTFDIEPRIAMLSFSNFGSVRHPYAEKVAKATQMVKQMRPDLIIDGEMQVDLAFDTELRDRDYSFSDLKGRANVLIFPSLEAGNIAYKLMMRLGGAEAIGPILVGLEKSVHVLQRNCDVDTIVRMCAIAAVDA